VFGTGSPAVLRQARAARLGIEETVA
jgi:hypothetical protein